jgi:nitroreductase
MDDTPLVTDAHALLTTTRAVRRRLDLSRRVPRALLTTCVELATQAPSGGNRQGFRFVIVDDPAQRSALAGIYRRAFEVYKSGPTLVTKAFAGDAQRTTVQERIYESVEYLALHLAEVPVHVIPVAPGRWEDRATTRAQAGFWGSVFPAVWSFQLACRMYGLGTALTTMHLEFDREAAEVIGLPHDAWVQVGLLPVAYTIGTDFRPVPRDPAADFIHWDRWSDTPEGEP